MCDPLALPDPLVSLTVNDDEAPSSQDMLAVCTSPVFASVKRAVTLTLVPTGTGAAGRAIAVTTGLAFSSATRNGESELTEPQIVLVATSSEVVTSNHAPFS